MQVLIQPTKLTGQLTAMPSKSYAHRAIIAAALSDNQSTINNVLAADDILATIDVLTGFGARFNWCNQQLIVQPNRLIKPNSALNCRNSASTLRFLLPLALYVDGSSTFTGDVGLAKRPLDDYLKLFRQHHCKISYQGKLPITLSGIPLAGEIKIAGDVSSQYITGILLTAPLGNRDITIHLTTALQSRAYVDITIDVLKQFGVLVKPTQTGWQITADQHYRATDFNVPGDYSNAAFWLVAGTIGAAIKLAGLKPVSLQGDRRIVDIINQMGGMVEQVDDGFLASPARTHGITLDVSQIVDLVPAIALLAAVSDGVTKLYGGARLRYKESDRIHSVVTQLRALGADILETDDGMIVTGKRRLTGGVVDSCNDHRIAMMLAIATIVCDQPVCLSAAEAVNKSYPQFFDHFLAVGGRYE